MQAGLLYLPPLDSPYYGLVPSRIWYKPWRWKLTALHLDGPNTVVASNLRRSEIIGLMRMFRVVNLGE